MIYMTDNEMLRKEQLFAFICLGGLTEGFDYFAEKEKMAWWSDQRRRCGWNGGYVETPPWENK